MKVRFQADADLNLLIIAALKRREPTVDFQTARQAGLTGLEDIAVPQFKSLMKNQWMRTPLGAS
ncbi:MAG TPA: hypothetical protein VJ023_02440 [Pyrinomonadaceae bacterium]|nr:hypothetical protein [Pyrinomonadaceae bacterium]